MEIKKKYGSDSLQVLHAPDHPMKIFTWTEDGSLLLRHQHTDNCARVCHSASVSGLAMTLGSGAMTNPIEDITKNADLIMLVGSNPEEAHPVVGMQIRQAIKRGFKLS